MNQHSGRKLRSSSPATPRVVDNPQELSAALKIARKLGKSIGLVPTMGALHAGHLSLVEASCRECDYTVVTIFVNPTQFGPGEDWERYPRNLAADLARLVHFPVDLVFAPSAAQMYRADHATFVEVGAVTEMLEGAIRPGHFRGVATIVLKLFNLVMPDAAFFGQKDFQQTVVVRRLIEDLNLPIELRICPTVRESDGLAMSSRNDYLSPGERPQALALSRSLRVGVDLIAAGQTNAGEVIEQIKQAVAAEPGVDVEYMTVADRNTLLDVERIDRPVVLLIAARVGKTRLIDNMLA